jgi:hypothetical protein
MATTTLLRYGWEHPCLRCGPGAFARYPDRHVLSSDEALERHADALAEELRELCGVRGRMLGLLRVGGRPARWPGCFCAAPKLLSYWMQERPGVRTDPGGECHLVELWCGAPTARRRHGERAWSCATCGRVLATLLCRAP